MVSTNASSLHHKVTSRPSPVKSNGNLTRLHPTQLPTRPSPPPSLPTHAHTNLGNPLTSLHISRYSTTCRKSPANDNNEHHSIQTSHPEPESPSPALAHARGGSQVLLRFRIHYRNYGDSLPGCWWEGAGAHVGDGWLGAGAEKGPLLGWKVSCRRRCGYLIAYKVRVRKIK